MSLAKASSGLLALLAMVAVTTAPSGSPAESSRPSTEKQSSRGQFESKVFRGRPAPERTSTGWIETDWGFGTTLCTGILIGPDSVLTARHCICAECTYRVGFGPRVREAGAGGAVVRALGAMPFPSGAGGAAFRYGRDLAVLRLPKDSDRASIAAPVPIAATRAFLFRGNPSFIAVGYGLTETGTSGTKLETDLRLTSGSCAQPWAQRARCISFREIVLDAARPASRGPSADTCRGDSGGPVFVRIGGQDALAALTSRALDPRAGGPVGAGCGFGGIYELVGNLDVLAWLDAQVPGLQVIDRR